MLCVAFLTFKFASVCVWCVCVFISETKMNAAVSFHKEAQFIFKKTALQLK